MNVIHVKKIKNYFRTNITQTSNGTRRHKRRFATKKARFCDKKVRRWTSAQPALISQWKHEAENCVIATGEIEIRAHVQILIIWRRVLSCQQKNIITSEQNHRVCQSLFGIMCADKKNDRSTGHPLQRLSGFAKLK